MRAITKGEEAEMQNEQNIRVIKKVVAKPQLVASDEKGCAILSGDVEPSRAREFYLTQRHALKMQLAALDKLLGLKPKCKQCGNET